MDYVRSVFLATRSETFNELISRETNNKNLWYEIVFKKINDSNSQRKSFCVFCLVFYTYF